MEDFLKHEDAEWLDKLTEALGPRLPTNGSFEELASLMHSEPRIRDAYEAAKIEAGAFTLSLLAQWPELLITALSPKLNRQFAQFRDAFFVYALCKGYQAAREEDGPEA